MLYLLAKISIVLTFPLEKRFPSRWVHLPSRFIDSPNSTKAFRRHRTSLRRMIRYDISGPKALA
jgi:hypothetical protein